MSETDVHAMSLAERAEQVTASLPEEARGALDPVLLRLVGVALDREESPVQREVPLEALLTIPGAAGLLEAWSRTDVILSAPGTEGVRTVRLASAELIGSWARLQKWVGAHQPLLVAREKIRLAALLWTGEKGATGYLLPDGPLLELAAGVTSAFAGDLTCREAAFIEASLFAAAERKTAAESTRLARVRRTRLVALVVAAAVGLEFVAVCIERWRSYDLQQRADAEMETARRRATEEAARSRREAEARLRRERELARQRLDRAAAKEKAEVLLRELSDRPTAAALGAVELASGFSEETVPSSVRYCLMAALQHARERWVLPQPVRGPGAVAVAPDGTRLAACLADGRLYVFGLDAQVLWGPTDVRGEPAAAVAFSPDGSLACASPSGSLALWNPRGSPMPAPMRDEVSVPPADFSVPRPRVPGSPPQGRPALFSLLSSVGGQDDALQVRRLESTAWVTCAAWSSDGRRLALAGEHGIAHVYAPGAVRQPLRLRSPAGSVQRLALGPDGRSVAVASSRQLRVWQDDGLTHRETATRGDILALAFDGSGGRLLFVDEWYGPRAWPLDGAPPESPWQTSLGLNAAAIAPAAERVVLATKEVMQVCDLAGQGLLPEAKVRLEYGTRLVSDASNRVVVSISRDNTARVLDFRLPGGYAPQMRHRGGALSVAFHPSGKLLASSGADGCVRLWDGHGNPAGGPFSHTGKALHHVAFSADGKQLLAVSETDRSYCFWDLSGRKLNSGMAAPAACNRKPFRDTPCPLVPSPDGRYLASIGETYRTTICPISGGTDWTVASLRGADSDVVAFAPSGKALAIAKNSGFLQVFSRSGRLLGRVPYLSDTFFSALAFSPDEKRLACGGRGGLHLWRLGEERLGSTLDTGLASALCVAFSPDGSLVASGWDDNLLRIWDIDGNQVVPPIGYATDRTYRSSEDRTYRVSREGVMCVAWSPDGRRLATAESDGPVHVWDLDLASCLRTAAERVHAHSEALNTQGQVRR